jgi:virginiamycin A acetyltransferase
VLKKIVKAIVLAVFLVIAFPMALLAGFGRLPRIFSTFAQLCAAIPGLPGDYLRIAYYRMTLDECSVQSRISYGSFFAHSQTRVAPGVYIGAYCVLGAAVIGARTMIASGVQILAGKNQHPRGADGRLAAIPIVDPIRIGSDCWLGAGAIIMDDVGDGSTIGAGAIVTRRIHANSIAVGNPARVTGSVSGRDSRDTDLVLD